MRRIPFSCISLIFLTHKGLKLLLPRSSPWPAHFSYSCRLLLLSVLLILLVGVFLALLVLVLLAAVVLPLARIHADLPAAVAGINLAQRHSGLELGHGDEGVGNRLILLPLFPSRG